ncbi:FAD-dependent monooxygenase [Acuticoccus sp. I52.16.1]|uniref:FAD-dependent monooxygenase n=1 Tax=Acuticoccus sp. I52.16.1 TaxID=2928472 RepID=UPI001FD30734|nr:FAD-dependent monooxygenase [Acuticoccus sp. I52.16.1]UOM34461.1 FAD-dependent monooxygenase [Acuticoccus sp. I52.16.1]
MFVVIGAGIAGLAASIALAEAGPVVVLERRGEDAANAGAGIQIAPNAVKALSVLGALEDVARVATAPEALVVRAPEQAAPLVRLPYGPAIVARYGAPYYTLSRAALHGALLAAALRRGVVVRHDHAARHVHQTDTGCTVAGAEMDAALVVAADGVNSSTRRALVGDAPRDTGWIAWRGTGDTAGGTTELVMGSGHHLVRYALSDEDANYVLVAPQKSRGPAGIARTPTGRLIADVAQWTPWPIAVRPRHVFAAGRVAFIGDAAHAMVPFLAQGAAMALEDAAILKLAVAALGPTPAALARYADARRPRTRRIAAMSEQQGSVYHLPFPLDRVRNATMRTLGPRAILRRVDPVYAWSVPEDGIA